jgi:hypothetical protein
LSEHRPNRWHRPDPFKGTIYEEGYSKIPFTDNSAHIKDDYCTKRRLQETINFLNPADFRGMRWLDVGAKNWVAEKVAEYLEEVPTHTDSDNDFNFTLTAPHKFYDVVTCFEVFEHIMNPLNFSINIGKLMVKGGVLYLSTPVHNPFGFYFNNTRHFSEYKISSVKTCLEYAGFEVIALTTFKSVPFWGGMRRGGGLFRTFVRVRSQETMLIRAVKK